MVLRDNVLQHVAVEKDQRAQRLVLRRRRQAPPQHQVVEKRLHVARAELAGNVTIAYDADFNYIITGDNKANQFRTGAARIVSFVRRLLGRGSGR
jgi:hypothetical protein